MEKSQALSYGNTDNQIRMLIENWFYILNSDRIKIICTVDHSRKSFSFLLRVG